MDRSPFGTGPHPPTVTPKTTGHVLFVKSQDITNENVLKPPLRVLRRDILLVLRHVTHVRPGVRDDHILPAVH